MGVVSDTGGGGDEQRIIDSDEVTRIASTNPYEKEK
jgi:hypothetical protein